MPVRTFSWQESCNTSNERRSAGSTILVGVDGGGTKTRACFLSRADGRSLQMTFGPSSLAVDVDGAVQVVSKALNEGLLRFGTTQLDRVTLALGMAGGNVPQLRTEFLRRLAHPGPAVVFDDSIAAHFGAFGGAAGVLVLAGTGSAAIAFDGIDTFRFSGGWGLPLGADPGSGVAIGLAAIRALQRTIDGKHRSSSLIHRLRTKIGSNYESVVNWCMGASAIHIASLASDVFAADALGDLVASEILDSATAGLIELVVDIEQEGLTGQVQLAGSVAVALINRFNSTFPTGAQAATVDPAIGSLWIAEWLATPDSHETSTGPRQTLCRK